MMQSNRIEAQQQHRVLTVLVVMIIDCWFLVIVNG